MTIEEYHIPYRCPGFTKLLLSLKQIAQHQEHSQSEYAIRVGEEALAEQMFIDKLH